MSTSILLVEDSAPVRVRLKELVERIDGFRVTGEATTVSEALSAIKSEKPGVVLLDLNLADGSGLDVLRGIKSLPARPTVIVLTANTEPAYRRACGAAGADYFFTKFRPLNELQGVLRLLGGKLA